MIMMSYPEPVFRLPVPVVFHPYCRHPSDGGAQTDRWAGKTSYVSPSSKRHLTTVEGSSLPTTESRYANQSSIHMAATRHLSGETIDTRVTPLLGNQARSQSGVGRVTAWLSLEYYTPGSSSRHYNFRLD